MLITILTDFGTQDTFVGVMRGVIKGIAPRAEIIDLTHQVPPQDIPAGAFALQTAYRFFPLGTIHLVIVDPGVGGARRPVAARLGDSWFVAPDNGVLSCVLAEQPFHEAVTLDNPQFHRPTVSRTFHGRDIFAPVAAHLANGVLLSHLGTPLPSLVTFPLPAPVVQGDVLLCHVITLDVFGNAMTDLTEAAYDAWAPSRVTIVAAGVFIPGPLSSYSDAAEGDSLALFGSHGFLEIAVRNGSARETLGLNRGDIITLRPA